MSAAANPHPGATGFLPETRTLKDLAAAAAGCQGCDLFAPATQTVFGRGNPQAPVVLVGEQPGDVEDREGKPFVGPAGHLLVRAIDEAGLDRSQLWVTNAVKHFKFELRPGGRRRIHQTPDTYEVAACRPWLQAELDVIRPALVIVLGATAAKSLLGPSFRVTQQRGQLLDGPPGSGAKLLATLHPSAILRTPDEERPAAYAGFVADLTLAKPFTGHAASG